MTPIVLPNDYLVPGLRSYEFDENGKIYFTDYRYSGGQEFGNNCIHVFNVNAEEHLIEYETSFGRGTVFSEDKSESSPYSICYDQSKSELYVADWLDNCIRIIQIDQEKMTLIRTIRFTGEQVYISSFLFDQNRLFLTQIKPSQRAGLHATYEAQDSLWIYEPEESESNKSDSD